MRDALTMRLVERVSHRDGQFQRVFQFERTACQSLSERLAFHILGHDVIGTVLMTDIDRRTDVRMAQRCDRLRLALEALGRFRMSGNMRWENLEDDREVQFRVRCFVRFARVAPGKRREDFIGTELRAAFESHTA